MLFLVVFFYLCLFIVICPLPIHTVVGGFHLLDGYETKEEINDDNFHNDLNIGEEMKIEYYD